MEFEEKELIEEKCGKMTVKLIKQYNCYHVRLGSMTVFSRPVLSYALSDYHNLCKQFENGKD